MAMPKKPVNMTRRELRIMRMIFIAFGIKKNVLMCTKQKRAKTLR